MKLSVEIITLFLVDCTKIYEAQKIGVLEVNWGVSIGKISSSSPFVMFNPFGKTFKI